MRIVAAGGPVPFPGPGEGTVLRQVRVRKVPLEQAFWQWCWGCGALQEVEPPLLSPGLGVRLLVGLARIVACEQCPER